jgi:hypothetical protein
MPYEEKPSTRRNRVVIAGLMWLVLILFFVGLGFLLGWLSLLFTVGSVWLTYDYVRRGSIANADTIARADG